MKKLLCMVLIVSLLMTTALAATFSDVPAGKWYSAGVEYCASQGYVTGYSNGTFKPGNNITRAELAVVMNKMLGLKSPANNTFSDVPSGKWFTEPILNCVKAGVITGYNSKSFGPSDPVTREQAAVIMAQAFQVEKASGRSSFADDGQIATWAVGYVKAMNAKGLITGTGSNRFSPKDRVTRGQVCTIINTAKNGPSKPSDGGKTPSGSDVTIKEQVLLDQSGIKITAKSLDFDDLFGPVIRVLIENNSGKNITVQARNVSVNGYMVDPIFSADVSNGKKANDGITIMQNELDRLGIKTIADVEFKFHIFESDSYENYYDSKPVVIKTSAADTYKYSYDDSGKLLYNANGLKIVYKGLDTSDEIFGPRVMLYLENTGSKDVCVQVRDVSVNGYMIDPIFSVDLPIGKHAVSGVTFMKEDLTENGISKIQSVDLSFHVFSWDEGNTIVDTSPITITA